MNTSGGSSAENIGASRVNKTKAMTNKLTKLQRVARAILGILVAPILAAVFLIDRFLMVFLVHQKAPTGIEYFSDLKYIGESVLRVVCFVALFLLYIFIW